MFGIAHLKGRYPRVSYRTEAPFLVAAGITFGLFTYLHHSIYSKCKMSY